jgi:hypothetical protein
MYEDVERDLDDSYKEVLFWSFLCLAASAVLFLCF